MGRNGGNGICRLSIELDSTWLALLILILSGSNLLRLAAAALSASRRRCNWIGWSVGERKFNCAMPLTVLFIHFFFFFFYFEANALIYSRRSPFHTAGSRRTPTSARHELWPPPPNQKRLEYRHHVSYLVSHILYRHRTSINAHDTVWRYTTNQSIIE